MYITYNIVKGNKYYHYEEKERVNGALVRTYFEYIGRLSDSELKSKLDTGIQFQDREAFKHKKESETIMDEQKIIDENKPVILNNDFKEQQTKAHLERIQSSEQVSRLESDLRRALEKGSNTSAKRKHIEVLKSKLERARKIDNRIQDNYNEQYLMKTRYTHSMEKVEPRFNTHQLYIEIPYHGDHINVKDESNRKIYDANWTGSRYLVNFNAPDGFNSRLYYNLRE